MQSQRGNMRDEFVEKFYNLLIEHKDVVGEHFIAQIMMCVSFNLIYSGMGEEEGKEFIIKFFNNFESDFKQGFYDLPKEKTYE